mgnify:CR=1 FL=1
MYHTGHPVGQPFGYDFFEFYVPGETEQRYKDVYGVDMPDQQITLRPGDSVFVDLRVMVRWMPTMYMPSATVIFLNILVV